MHAVKNKTKLTHEELMKPIGDQKFLKAMSFLDFTLGLSASSHQTYFLKQQQQQNH